MARTISAGYTLIAKIFAILWIVGFGAGTIAMFVFASAGNEAPTGKFLFFWICGSIFLYWSALRLKKITIDGDSLRISNYLKAVSVPISKIRDITDASIIPLHPLFVIRLRSATALGDKIVFQPSSFSAVKALREASRQHKPTVTSNGV
jgi:hypothetical protein